MLYNVLVGICSSCRLIQMAGRTFLLYHTARANFNPNPKIPRGTVEVVKRIAEYKKDNQS